MADHFDTKKPPAGMKIQEQLEMLQRCRAEIELLRSVIDRLKPKAEAYDALRQVLDMIPAMGSKTMGEDLVWMLNKKHRELEREYAPHKAKEALGINEETENG